MNVCKTVCCLTNTVVLVVMHSLTFFVTKETIKPSSIDENRVMGKQSKTLEDKTTLVLAGTISAAAVLIAITITLVMVKNRRKTGYDFVSSNLALVAGHSVNSFS